MSRRTAGTWCPPAGSSSSAGAARAHASATGVHMLPPGGRLPYASAAEREVKRAGRESGRSTRQREVREAVVATETGMLYPLQMAAPDVHFIPGNPHAS